MNLRTPSNRTELYSWWRRALRAQAQFGSLKEAAKAGVTIPEIIVDEPQCGFYRRKLVKGGPFVPARIFLRQVVNKAGELVEPERLVCEIGGKEFDAAEQWPWLADRPIREAEYRHGIAHRAWRTATVGERETAAVETSPVDFQTMAPPKFRRQRKRA